MTTNTNTNTEVLIIGAGPTGMTLALWLTRLGVACRIVDKAAGPGETSRALAVQARTLEFHRQIGLADDVIAAGVKIEQLSIRTPRKIAAALKLAKFGEGLSKYPFAFALPQDVHERVMLEHLVKNGVSVERRTELAGFTQDADGVTATLCKGTGSETVRAKFLVGCDGAHSAVRHGLNLAFPGGAYDQSFYVADVQGEGEYTKNGMDVAIDAYGFAITMPVRQFGSLRLIGVVPEAHEKDEAITFEALRGDIEKATGITVKALNWFSTYRVHHRVAEKFRVGRVFVAGDAGHIHSPAGGQGMNTGIGDAVNLSWKLAAVLQGRADLKLLDTYEIERLSFARLLIKSTDQAFKLITGRTALSRIWRKHVMPRFASLVVENPRGARIFFKLVSQTRINYRDSAASDGRVGKVRAGDRLPYAANGANDNFAPLSALDWQVHVYGVVGEAFRRSLAATGIQINAFAWSDATKAAGLKRDAAYLVRPDGHVALATRGQDAAAFVSYVARHKLKARQAAVESRYRKLALAS